MALAISILDDVLGPIMRGPSSSHTAGAYRIASVAWQLLGESVTTARCTFDPDGSFAPTCEALGVDLAIATGLLGWDLTDVRFVHSLETLRSQAAIDFAVDPLVWADHPNTVQLDLEGASGRRLSIRAASTGGGSFDVHHVDGVPVHIGGRAWHVFARTPKGQLELVRSALADALVDGRDLSAEPLQTDMTLHWRSLKGLDRGILAGLDQVRIQIVEPLLHPQIGEPLLTSGADALRLTEAGMGSLGEIALRHEAALLGFSDDELRSEMGKRWAVMKESIASGQRADAVCMALTVPSAAGILAAERSGGLPLGGPQTRAAARALAVMHVCNSRGVVCAAPTGGSAGVLPGVMSVVEEDTQACVDTILRALFAASAIGVIFASRATFAAEIGGCQMEIGAAGAMAAAAIVEAFGGTPRQAMDAASISLQNTMGSVCDPVAGGCEIPCHTRNAAAAAGAFTTADLVMGGYANPIPLDEAIDASFAVGKALPPELRCTARGGIAVTPSALRLSDGRSEGRQASRDS